MGSTTGLNLDLESVLSHYGIKGMKWGVRRTPEQLGRARAQRKAKKAAVKKQKQTDRSLPASEDSKRASESRRIAANAGPQKLSNKELEFLVNRMNLENRYINTLGNDSKSTGRQLFDKYMDVELKAIRSNKKRSPTGVAADKVGELLKTTFDYDSTLEKALKN